MVSGSVMWFQETQAGGAVSDSPVGISSVLWVLEPTHLTLPSPLLTPHAWLRASGSQTHSVTASLAHLRVSLRYQICPPLSICLCWLLISASLLNLEGPSLAACSPCLLTHLLFIFHVGAKISIKKKRKKIWSYTTLWLKTFHGCFATYRFQSPLLSKDLHVLGTFCLSKLCCLAPQLWLMVRNMMNLPCAHPPWDSPHAPGSCPHHGVTLWTCPLSLLAGELLKPLGQYF